MGPGMFDGLGRAIGCMVLLALLAGIAAGACMTRCPLPYTVKVERRG